MTKLSLCIFLLAAGVAQAQITSATLVGTVTDQTGASVAGAKVQAKNNATFMSRSAKSDGAGEYSIPDLPAGHYTLSIEASGFKTFVAPNIELLVAQRAMINASMEVGAVQQNVTVDAAAPMIDTSSASVGQVVNTGAVEQMPLNGRSFWQLTALTPGATYTPGGQTTHTGGSTIRASVVNVYINGGAQDETGWTLDGAFITEMQSGGTMVQPNIDALSRTSGLWSGRR